MLVGIFGMLPFTCSAGFVQTFSRFSRTLSEKWAKHQVIGGKPVLEWTGSESASITLSVRLDASLGLPPSAGMLMLKAMLESHDAYSLVIGTDYFGKFVLEGIEEDRRHFMGAGICLVDEVSLKLTEHSRGWA